jgi:hypothetical protein
MGDHDFGYITKLNYIFIFKKLQITIIYLIIKSSLQIPQNLTITCAKNPMHVGLSMLDLLGISSHKSRTILSQACPCTTSCKFTQLCLDGVANHMMMIIRNNNILTIGMQFRCFMFTWLNSEFSLTYSDLKRGQVMSGFNNKRYPPSDVVGGLNLKVPMGIRNHQSPYM